VAPAGSIALEVATEIRELQLASAAAGRGQILATNSVLSVCLAPEAWGISH
jgi:hypothetical protein